MHCAKKDIFWRKLTFKTKEQERYFMISFKGMPKNLKGTFPSAWCIIDSTEHFYKTLVPHRPIQSLFYSSQKHDVKCSNLRSSIFYQQLWSESISYNEIVCRICSLNETLWEKNYSMTDRVFFISDDIENIGASLNVSAFLEWWRKIKKSRSERKPSYWFS